MTKNGPRRRERMSYDTAFAVNGKTPPQAVDLEEAVLGALMLDADALTNTIETIQPEYFYKPEHQYIFQAIRTLFEKGKQVDILTVAQQLASDGRLEEVGGNFYVAQLTNRVVSAAHIENHAHILAEKYMQRELIRIGTETIRDSYDNTVDVLTLLDKTEQHLLEVSDKNLHSDYHSIGEVMGAAINQIDNAQNKADTLVGLPSGYLELDRRTAGFQPGTLVIIAARPAMGKTAFALSVARNMAVEFGRPVAFFSLEMTAVELVMRLIASESHISGERLKKGERLEEWERDTLKASAEVLRNAPMYIDDTPSLTIFELRAKCRRLKQRYHVEAVFIDYLQLMQASSDMNRNANREQEISTISR
ncbi:MAG: replicative DNA helicase, partial [Bacteroidales bacterium]|nr:replicative DNA helicase [Bacteroidales bacterium]